MNTSNLHHRTFFAGITLFLSFFAATAFGQQGALTPALVKTVRQCTQIGSFHEGMAVACKNGRYGYIRRDGRWAVRPKYEMAFDFSEGRGAVVKKGRLGFVDNIGKEVIACVYDYDDERRKWLDVEPYAFHNGMMVVRLHGGDDGVIDRNGKVRVPFGIYTHIWNFEDGVAFVWNNHPLKDGATRYQLVDTNGNVVFNIPDTLDVGPLQGYGGRCLGASVHVKDTADENESYVGYMDMKGRMVLPPIQHGRIVSDSKRWVCIKEYIYRSGDEEEHVVYHCLYDLHLQKEVPLSSEEIFRFMDSCYNAPVFAEGKCFVNKEVDGKKRVVVQDSSGRELWTLPLGVYDCQPWSEGLSVVRLKDGQSLRYGLMDAEGNLTFRKAELAEAERLVFAQLSLPSWPELKLDSQWIAEQSQLLEEAYQEKSEEKKQLFFRRCAEAAAAALPRTDNDTLREVEEVFKTFFMSRQWENIWGRMEWSASRTMFLQSDIPNLVFCDKLEPPEKKEIQDDDDWSAGNEWSGMLFVFDWGGVSNIDPEHYVFHFKNVGQFYPRMVDTVGLIFPGVPAISQIVSDFIFRKNGESFDSLHCRCEPWCCRMLFLFVPVNDLDSGYFGDDPYPHVTTIVFSKGMKQAMVGFRTGDRSGKIGYCLLKRKGRKWKAIRYVTPIEYI